MSSEHVLIPEDEEGYALAWSWGKIGQWLGVVSAERYNDGDELLIGFDLNVLTSAGWQNLDVSTMLPWIGDRWSELVTGKEVWWLDGTASRALPDSDSRAFIVTGAAGPDVRRAALRRNAVTLTHIEWIRQGELFVLLAEARMHDECVLLDSEGNECGKFRLLY